VLLAVSALDPTLKMLFFGAALLLFLLAAFGVAAGRVSLLALGLAAFSFPWFWDSLAAS